MILSKEFFEQATCQDILHPGEACGQALFKRLIPFFISNVKYFFPIVAVPVIIKGRKVTRQLLKKQLRKLLELAICGQLVGFGAYIYICLLRNILGRFHVYTLYAIPLFTASFHSIFATRYIQDLYTYTGAQSVLDTQLLGNKNIIFRLIRSSKLIQTILFMSWSAIILHILKKGEIKLFWFIQPPSKRSDINDSSIEEKSNSKSICNHNNSCLHYTLTGIKDYFILGMCLEVAKAIFAKTPKYDISFTQYLFNKLKTIKFKTTTFFVSYAGLYRILDCAFNKYLREQNNVGHIISAFLAGVSFIFLPKYELISYGLIVSMDLLWKNFILHDKKRSPNIERLKNLRYGYILMPFMMAYALHIYGYYPRISSNITHSYVNGVTNNSAIKVRNAASSFVPKTL